MANVTATTGWVFAADAHPNGALTIDSGSNRKLVVFHGRENNTNPAPTITVGGQSPTETFSNYFNPISATDHWLYAWIWDESAISAMSGSTVAFGGTTATFGRFWGYGTVENTSQSALSAFDDTDTSETGPLSLATTSSSGDLIVALAISATIGQTFTGWDTLTEVFDADIDGARGGFAAGNGGDAATTISVSVSEPCSAASLVFVNLSTKYLKLLAESTAQSDSAVAGVVMNGSTYIGTFTGQAFSGTLEGTEAVLLVSVADISPDGSTLTTDDTPTVFAYNTTDGTTGPGTATVIEV